MVLYLQFSFSSSCTLTCCCWPVNTSDFVFNRVNELSIAFASGADTHEQRDLSLLYVFQVHDK